MSTIFEELDDESISAWGVDDGGLLFVSNGSFLGVCCLSSSSDEDDELELMLRSSSSFSSSSNRRVGLNDGVDQSISLAFSNFFSTLNASSFNKTIEIIII